MFSAWVAYYERKNKKYARRKLAEQSFVTRLFTRWKQNTHVSAVLNRINRVMLSRTSEGLQRLGWLAWRKYLERARRIRWAGEMVFGRTGKKLKRAAFLSWQRDHDYRMTLKFKQNDLLRRLFYTSRKGAFDAWKMITIAEKTLEQLSGHLTAKSEVSLKRLVLRAWNTEAISQRKGKRKLEYKLKQIMRAKKSRLLHKWHVLLIVTRFCGDNAAKSLCLRPFRSWHILTKQRKRTNQAARKIRQKRQKELIRPWIFLTKEKIREKLRERKKDKWRLKLFYLAFCKGCHKSRLLTLKQPFLLWKFIAAARLRTRTLMSELFQGVFVRRWAWKKPRREKVKLCRRVQGRRRLHWVLAGWHESIYLTRYREQLVTRRAFFQITIQQKRRELWRLSKLAGFLKARLWEYFTIWKKLMEKTNENLRVVALKRKIRQRERESRPSFYYNICEFCMKQWKRLFLARRQYRLKYGVRVLQLWSSVALKNQDRIDLLNRRRNVRDFSYVFSYCSSKERGVVSGSSLNGGNASLLSSVVAAGSFGAATGGAYSACSTPRNYTKPSLSLKQQLVNRNAYRVSNFANSSSLLVHKSTATAMKSPPGNKLPLSVADGDAVELQSDQMIASPSSKIASTSSNGPLGHIATAFLQHRKDNYDVILNTKQNKLPSRGHSRSKSLSPHLSPARLAAENKSETLSRYSSKGSNVAGGSSSSRIFVVPTKSTKALGGAFSDSCHNRALSKGKERRGVPEGNGFGVTAGPRQSSAGGASSTMKRAHSRTASVAGNYGNTASRMRSCTARSRNYDADNKNERIATTLAPKGEEDLVMSPPRRPPLEHPPPSAQKQNPVEQALFGPVKALQPIGVNFSDLRDESALEGQGQLGENVEGGVFSTRTLKSPRRESTTTEGKKTSAVIDYFRYGSSPGSNNVGQAKPQALLHSNPNVVDQHREPSRSISPKSSDGRAMREYGCDWFVSDAKAQPSTGTRLLKNFQQGGSSSSTSRRELVMGTSSVSSTQLQGPDTSPRRILPRPTSRSPPRSHFSKEVKNEIEQASSKQSERKMLRTLTTKDQQGISAAPPVELSLQSRTSSKAKSIHMVSDGKNPSGKEVQHYFEPAPRENAEDLSPYIPAEYNTNSSSKETRKKSRDRVITAPGGDVADWKLSSMSVPAKDTSEYRSSTKQSNVSSVFSSAASEMKIVPIQENAGAAVLSSSSSRGRTKEDLAFSPESSRILLHAPSEEHCAAIFPNTVTKTGSVSKNLENFSRDVSKQSSRIEQLAKEIHLLEQKALRDPQFGISKNGLQDPEEAEPVAWNRHPSVLDSRGSKGHKSSNSAGPSSPASSSRHADKYSAVAAKQYVSDLLTNPANFAPGGVFATTGAVATSPSSSRRDPWEVFPHAVESAKKARSPERKVISQERESRAKQQQGSAGAAPTTSSSKHVRTFAIPDSSRDLIETLERQRSNSPSSTREAAGGGTKTAAKLTSRTPSLSKNSPRAGPTGSTPNTPSPPPKTSLLLPSAGPGGAVVPSVSWGSVSNRTISPDVSVASEANLTLSPMRGSTTRGETAGHQRRGEVGGASSSATERANRGASSGTAARDITTGATSVATSSTTGARPPGKLEASSTSKINQKNVMYFYSATSEQQAVPQVVEEVSFSSQKLLPNTSSLTIAEDDEDDTDGERRGRIKNNEKSLNPDQTSSCNLSSRKPKGVYCASPTEFDVVPQGSVVKDLHSLEVEDVVDEKSEDKNRDLAGRGRQFVKEEPEVVASSTNNLQSFTTVYSYNGVMSAPAAKSTSVVSPPSQDRTSADAALQGATVVEDATPKPDRATVGASFSKDKVVLVKGSLGGRKATSSSSTACADREHDNATRQQGREGAATATAKPAGPFKQGAASRQLSISHPKLRPIQAPSLRVLSSSISGTASLIAASRASSTGRTGGSATNGSHSNARS
ncbi:unnamed protein product [Amoebophrya sp. A120]|nr:unnamed protein product [Amoebophrya sp. A120]|eukprot:GSA120T00007892001.1